MPNKKACKNRLLLRRTSQLPIVKDCFAAVLSASGLIATASIGFGQSNQYVPINETPEGIYRQSHTSASGPSATSYLPASPWSKRVSYEQPTAPERIEVFQSQVLKQPNRKPAPNKVVESPAGITWGVIREIQPQERYDQEAQQLSQSIELADVPSVRLSPSQAPKEMNQDTELAPSEGAVSRMASSGRSFEKSAIENESHDSNEEGIFLLPAAPQENASEPRGVGQFASTRESMTRTRPIIVPAEPEQVPETTSSQPSLQEAERMRIAQIQSHELRSIPVEPAYAEPRLLESPVGWKAVRQDLAKHLETCDSLLKRGATHSARAEVLVGLRKCGAFFGFRETGVVKAVGRPGNAGKFGPFDVVGEHLARLQVFYLDTTPVRAAF